MTEIVLKPMSWYHVEEHKFSNQYNNGNLHTYDPYYVDQDGELVVDQEWWDHLTPHIQELIEERLGDHHMILETNLKIPHQLYEGPLVNLVYRAYLDGFDYQVWYDLAIEDGPTCVEIVDLLPNWKETLARISRRRLSGGGSLTDQELVELRGLNSAISQCLRRIPDDLIFLRLSGTSGKNEVALKPARNSLEILDQITNNKLFLNQEYERAEKETSLILMPWKVNFNERYEFRIFVVDGKLTGISQQKWFHLFQYSAEELYAIRDAMTDLRFLKDLPYSTLVADVWVDLRRTKCYLIECNPFGEHCGAGSSLFNWIDDRDQLYGLKDKVEFRYLSILKDI